jgi:anti-sigma regulatory factor (Ser/Thr protein kinase)
VHTANGVTELRARGMPLGLMPGMQYEEKEAVLAPGESILLHSDGLAEAHNAQREMFGFPRLKQMVAEHAGGQKLIDELLTALDRFTPAGWEQEDDITLVTLSRSPGVSDEEVLCDFMVESVPGNERQVMDRVADAVQGMGLAPNRVERLKTAVAEAAMNAIEHGNEGQRELLVAVRVAVAEGDLIVRITDQGGGAEIPEAETPDLDAKLAGLQKPRGWGLFLIKNMVDDLRVHTDERHHTVELVLHLNGDGDGDNRN